MSIYSSFSAPAPIEVDHSGCTLIHITLIQIQCGCYGYTFVEKFGPCSVDRPLGCTSFECSSPREISLILIEYNHDQCF